MHNFRRNGPGGLVLIVVLLLFSSLLSNCNYPSPDSDVDDTGATQAYVLTQSMRQTKTREAEEASQQQETEQANSEMASATAQAEMTITEIAANRSTAASNATSTEQESRDLTATARAQATDTPTATLKPTQTLTLPPQPTKALKTNTPAANPPSTGMIVRSPGEKSPGDHGVTVKNKTGANVTIIMYGDPFDYTFYVPDGNHKIFVRPGNYSFTIYACGGATSGSGIFNSNWYWEFKCK